MGHVARADAPAQARCIGGIETSAAALRTRGAVRHVARANPPCHAGAISRIVASAAALRAGRTGHHGTRTNAAGRAASRRSRVATASPLRPGSAGLHGVGADQPLRTRAVHRGVTTARAVAPLLADRQTRAALRKSKRRGSQQDENGQPNNKTCAVDQSHESPPIADGGFQSKNRRSYGCKLLLIIHRLSNGHPKSGRTDPPAGLRVLDFLRSGRRVRC